jgi:hypothetical protein
MTNSRMTYDEMRTNPSFVIGASLLYAPCPPCLRGEFCSINFLGDFGVGLGFSIAQAASVDAFLLGLAAMEEDKEGQ